jgi:predicted metalloprotease with PDZ domain
MPEPHTHLFHVELRVDGHQGPLDLVMPSWTPGSYLLREFPRHLQGFRVRSGSGDEVRWEKLDKNSWRVHAPAGGAVVRYEVYANDLTVRTSHLDATHGYVNGASVFLWLRGAEAAPVELTVEPPSGWRVTSALPPADAEPADGRGAVRFRAEDFAQLFDSPIEIGTHRLIEWQTRGVPHRYAVWGRGDIDEDRLVRDTTRVVETVVDFWGGSLPYSEYTFFLHLLPGGRGGLEHRNSCSLHADPHQFGGPAYEQFIALVLHEYFHTWNGTRLRPEPLVRPDLTRENYTRNLWIVEGLTTYYTDLLLLRAGLITAERYLERLADSVNRWLAIPGRHLQSLADSSFDTWIRFYRPDEHTPNAQVSYYHKGALVGLLLDLHIRGRTEGRHSLDDVMRGLWERYGARDIGYPEETKAGIQAIAEEVCGEPLGDLFERYLHGTGDLPLAEALATVGLELRSDTSAAGPSDGRGERTTDAPRGLTAAHAASAGAVAVRHVLAVGTSALVDPVFRAGIRLEPGSTRVAHVRAGSPAHRSGINARDEIVALDGHRVSAVSLPQRIAARGPEPVRVALFRRGELRELELAGASELPAPVKAREAESATAEQRARRAAWLE